MINFLDDNWLSSLDQYKTTPEPMPSANIADEERREMTWALFEQDILQFAEDQGWPAVLKCVAHAMAQQRELFK